MVGEPQGAKPVFPAIVLGVGIKVKVNPGRGVTQAIGTVTSTNEVVDEPASNLIPGFEFSGPITSNNSSQPSTHFITHLPHMSSKWVNEVTSLPQWGPNTLLSEYQSRF